MGKQDWSQVGDEIKDAVQTAIDTRDFTRLNASISKTVNMALDQFEQVLDGKQTENSREQTDDPQMNSKNRADYQSEYNRNQADRQPGSNWYNHGGTFTGWSKDNSNWKAGNQRNRKWKNGSWGSESESRDGWKDGNWGGKTQSFQTAGSTVLSKYNEKSSQYPNRYASTSAATVLGILGTVFGWVLTVGCGLAEFVMLMVSVVGVADIEMISEGLQLAMGILAPFLAGGILLAVLGHRTLGLIKRYKKYVSILGDKEYCELEELEYASGSSHKKLLKDLKKMIKKEWFRQGHLDLQETSLIVTDQAYIQYREAQNEYKRREVLKQKQEDSPKLRNSSAAEAADAATEQPFNELPEEVRNVIHEGRTYLRQIKQSNDAIPGEEISAKISRLELVTDKILNRVEQHPELVEELRRFMKYYLPTTVKLLKAYEDLDRQPVQGPNIIRSKTEIEATLDTINRAFENLLDSFFEDAAVDISSDISVMQTLMAQEGLLRSSMKEKEKRL